MRKLICICIAALFICAQSLAAAAKQPEALSNEFFKIEIPEGWTMPNPPTKQPMGGTSVAFLNSASGVAVTFNFMKIQAPAREFAMRMTQDMKGKGLKVSTPVEDNGLYKFTISGKASGIGWVGSDSGVCAATLIFGNDPEAALPILKAMQPVNKKLLPTAVK